MLDHDKLHLLIGERIRQIRETRTPKMSQQQLADVMRLKRTSITNIELGNQKPTLDGLYLLCEHFGLTIESVLPTVAELVIQGHGENAHSVTVGGQSHEVGARTAELVEKLRPRNRALRK